MTRIFLILVLSLLSQAQGKGQSQIKTGPVTEKDVVYLRLQDAKTLDEAMNTIIRLRVDSMVSNSEPYSTLVAARKCNRQGNFYECEAYIPSDIVARLNVPGNHNLYAFVFDSVGESGPSNNWTLTTPK